MTPFQILLFVLLVASIVLSLVAAVLRDVRWLSLSFGAFVVYLFCNFVNAL